jgi:lysophospholipase L1-like esterase
LVGAAVVFFAAAELAFGAAPASASVLDVGDSLTVGSASVLKRIVPGIQINAETGRTSSTGVSILADEYRGQGVVVFDLGTNDSPSAPGQLLGELEEARRIVGNACLVLATINRPPVGGTSYDGMNRVIENFSFRDGNAQVVPWADYPEIRPQVVYADGVHVTPYGYTVRAHLIADAIAACGGATLRPAGGQSHLPPPASAGTQPPASGADEPAQAPPERQAKPPAKRRWPASSFVARVIVDGAKHLSALASRLP